MEDIGARITEEVASWDGVTVHAHRFGGVEFRLGRRELGHLHATWADLPFTSRIREMLVQTGRAEPHKFGIKLRLDLMKGIGPFSTRKHAEAAEKAVADALEQRGHRVFWG